MVLAYGMPGVGAGYMYLLLGLYVMKFSTDVLLIAPAVMGIIFSMSRVWDAISDPVVGYLSDRTRSRLGRRRSWMLASLVPVALAFLMVFAPPRSLSGTGLTLWMAVAVIGYYSAMTTLFVPHLSLGAELSANYHERSRLFGYRHAFYTIGSILSLISMYILIGAEAQGPEHVRDVAFNLALIAIVAVGALIVIAVAVLEERVDFVGRTTASPLGAFRDVWANVHARLIIVVTFVEHIGSAAIGVLTLYVAQYVVGMPGAAPLLILAYMVPSTITVPLWIPVSRRIGKRRLWTGALLFSGLAFGGMFALPFIDSQNVKLVWMFAMAVLAGAAAGAGGTISPSIQGDVIDYDELMTGERKEGSYFAAWNFVYKGAMGVMLLLTGFVLDLSGFSPNAEQTMTVKLAMVSLYGLVPLVCYSLAALLLTRFTLNEEEHASIRAALGRV